MPTKEIPMWLRKMGRITIRSFVEFTSNGVFVEGKENIPKKPPYIIAFNHSAWVEGLLPQIILPIKDWPYTMTKIENLKGILGKILPHLGFFGIHRGVIDTLALNKATDILQSGHILSTSPEGTRGRESQRTEIKDGRAGIIYLSTQQNPPVPIVPMAVWGQNERTFPLIDEKGLVLREFKYIRNLPQYVKFGLPFIPEINPNSSEKRSEQLKRLANELMQQIRNLLPSDHANNYSQR